LRGEIYWAAIDPHRPTRPVCVVQADSLNSSAPTLIVLPLVPAAPRAGWPLTLEVPAGTAGFEAATWLQLTKPLTIARDGLKERVGVLPAEFLDRLDQGLRVVLSLA
jgi:mRNA-degrading endonuclease toxin of MazEF toxin-antitoxin module